MADESKRRNAVQYAEETLGVHVPWQDAQKALIAHDNFCKQWEDFRGVIRDVKQKIDDRRMELMTEAPSMDLWPDGVQKQRDFVKALQADDEEHARLEKELAKVQAELDHVDMGRKHQEQKLYAVTARMIELGGLLQFYASAKNAEANGSPSGE